MGAIGAGLATIVVMCLTRPRTGEEWTVGIITTLVASFAGGCFVILHYDLLDWVIGKDGVRVVIGLMAILGVAFSCGLPGWALVRWLFNYINKRRDADLAAVVSEVRSTIQ